MLIKLRNRMAREESGFTLIELLVVMLILGILAAIAIPAFLNQREKGQDAEAKAGVRTMETAAETFATDNNGSYTGMDLTDLTNIEAAVADVPDATPTVTPSATGDGYTLTVDSEAGRPFTLTRADNGDKTRTCGPPNGGGCVGGSW